ALDLSKSGGVRAALRPLRRVALRGALQSCKSGRGQGCRCAERARELPGRAAIAVETDRRRLSARHRQRRPVERLAVALCRDGGRSRRLDHRPAHRAAGHGRSADERVGERLACRAGRCRAGRRDRRLGRGSPVQPGSDPVPDRRGGAAPVHGDGIARLSGGSFRSAARSARERAHQAAVSALEPELAPRRHRVARSHPGTRGRGAHQEEPVRHL
ncbi:MAG: hypothetical protein AVDCRST_MAG90-2534, partial [uncultured Microvirga sp.]